jgi:hypothetical protein
VHNNNSSFARTPPPDLSCSRGKSLAAHEATDEKERLQGYASLKGNQGESVARIKLTFVEKLTKD